MKNWLLPFILLFFLSTCKKDEESSAYVSVTVENASEGSVDFEPGDFAIGSSITVTAIPNTGYIFSGWTNTATNQTYTNNPLTITIEDNTNLIASFEKATYNVNVNVIGEGSVQKEVLGGGGFTHGSQISLTAVPAEDYSFFYWNNDPGDTDNPKTITLDSNKEISANFDYTTAKDLIGTWEFTYTDPASRNITIIRMSIDIMLNVVMTTIVNGNLISKIYTHLITISATTILIGDFAVMTNIVVTTATSISMTVIPLPDNTSIPENDSEVPDSENGVTLNGDKVEDEFDKDEDDVIIPPTDATTASSTTDDIGELFEDSIGQFSDSQSSTSSSNTTDTGTSTSTTADTNCTLDATLQSDSSDNQTVTIGSAIEDILYDITTDCERVIHLVSSSGFPNGVGAIIEGDRLIISGTPSGGSSGTFNYEVLLDNHLEPTEVNPFVSATVSKVISGSIRILNSENNSSTLDGKTYIPDDNFEQALIDLGYDDVLDDYVTTGIIRDIEILILQNMGIESLVGIQDFSNLIELRVSNMHTNSIETNDEELNARLAAGIRNNIKFLDLNSNKLLQYVDLQYNLEFTELKISELDFIMGLNLSGCSILENIDLTSNRNLTWLNLGFMNNMIDLDISNQPELGYLSLRANRSFEEIDISKNNKLVRFDATYTQLKCIQVSQFQLDNQINNSSIDGVSSGITVKFKEDSGQVFEVDWEKDDEAEYSLNCYSGTTSDTSSSTCSITFNDISNTSDGRNYSVVQGEEMMRIEFEFETDCEGDKSVSNIEGLPDGWDTSASFGLVRIGGSTNVATGTYNWSVTAYAGTTSFTLEGVLNITSTNTGTTSNETCKLISDDSWPGEFSFALGEEVDDTKKYEGLNLFGKCGDDDIHTGILQFEISDQTEVPPGMNISVNMGDEIAFTGTPTTAGIYNWSAVLSSTFLNTQNNQYQSLTYNVTATITIVGSTTTNTTDTNTSTNSGTNSSTSTNDNCSISGSITSASGSDNQTVVQGNQLQTITYSINSDCNQLNDTNIYGQQLVSGLPPGVTASLNGNTLTISGTPTSQASGTYNYSIVIDDSVSGTDVTPYYSPTASTTITGIINVEVPVDELVLTSSQDTIDQAICDGSAITPITYQLGGSATNVSGQGFPSGVSIGPITNNIISIEGTPSVNVITSTLYNYSITSNGSQSKTVTGSITVHPPSQITRTSGDANIEVNSLIGLNEDQLANSSFNLSFQIANAVEATVFWDDDALTNSINISLDENTGILSISGNPKGTDTTAHPQFKTYNYIITTNGNIYGCDEASISGSIKLVDAYVQTYTINVTASDTNNYTLNGSDRNGSVSGSDPSVTVNIGDTIDFAVDASGHPFYLKTAQGTGTGDLISGVTNNGATNGTVSWTPNAAGTYYYQCSLHNDMYGTITVN